MNTRAVAKPMFGRDQIIPASVAGRKFGEIRKRAKRMPQFISEHNEIDSVVLDYQTYESMFVELEAFREKQLYELAAERVRASDFGTSEKGRTLQELMSEGEWAEFEAMDPDGIADEDLFE